MEGRWFRVVKETPEFLEKKEKTEKLERFRREVAEANGFGNQPLIGEKKERNSYNEYPFTFTSTLYVIALTFVGASHFVLQHLPTSVSSSLAEELFILSGCQLTAYLLVLPVVAFGGRNLRIGANVLSGLIVVVLLLALRFGSQDAPSALVVFAKFFVCLVQLLSQPQIAACEHLVLISLATTSASRTIGVWVVVQISDFRHTILVFGVASFAFQSIAAAALLWPSKTESRDDGASDDDDTGSLSPSTAAASTKTIDIDYASSNLSVDLHV
ncbi:hypothetical protein L596_028223 [Steinernema carpocapsae]|uniref:Uncharacterized protein n=1 Tax=Steinernema carpocapsae TaxID=34508 RepID=A0A4U5LXV2_STECR|nr:hypothetical protein L596_028223 [Steinernema carpocapsae]